MPTSSQALILKVTDGHLPPIFGRHVRHRVLTHNYPVSNHNLSNKLIRLGDRSALTYSNLRTSSAQNHYASNEFSALSGLLKVHGLKGDLSFDASLGSLNYRVDELPSIRYDGWTEFNQSGKRVNVGVEQRKDTKYSKIYSKADLERGLGQRRTNVYQRQHKFVKILNTGDTIEECSQEHSDYFKLVKSAGEDRDVLIEETVYETNTSTNTEVNTAKFPDTYQSTEPNGCINTGIKKTSSETKMEKYLNPQNKTYESKGVKDTETNQNAANKSRYFKLIKSTPDDAESFRLAKTEHEEFGDFYLVFPDGKESSEEYRLVSSDKFGRYSIFMSTDSDPDTFSLLEPDMVQGDEFKMITTRRYDKQLGPLLRRPQLNNHLKGSNAIDKREPSFGQTMQLTEEHINYDHFNTSSGRQGTRQHIHDQESNNIYASNTDEFEAGYRQHLDYDSSEMYKRLTRLGFRDAESGVKLKPVTKTNDSFSGNICSTEFVSAEWRTINFDKWKRTTEHTQVLEDTLTVESARLVQSSKPLEDGPSRASLIEELKMNPGYKQWKNKKVASVRARKELPPEDPYALCLTLSDNAISHDTMMKHVQRATGNQLLSLQFDPVSVHTIDGAGKSQWILRFSDKLICDNLLNKGISIMGNLYALRRYDDVMKEEYDAYKFNEIVQKISEHKSKKQQKKGKKLKSTETQTPIGA